MMGEKFWKPGEQIKMQILPPWIPPLGEIVHPGPSPARNKTEFDAVIAVSEIGTNPAILVTTKGLSQTDLDWLFGNGPFLDDAGFGKWPKEPGVYVCRIRLNMFTCGGTEEPYEADWSFDILSATRIEMPETEEEVPPETFAISYLKKFIPGGEKNGIE